MTKNFYLWFRSMKAFRSCFLGGVIFICIVSIVFATRGVSERIPFPNPLDLYGDYDLVKSGEITDVLLNRIYHTPFNLWASIIFLFAIIHTFFASKITAFAKSLESNHKEKMRVLPLKDIHCCTAY